MERDSLRIHSETTESQFQAEVQSYNRCQQRCAVVTAVIIVCAYVTCVILFVVFLVFSVHNKTDKGKFKWLCVNQFPNDDYCFISVGQYSIGLIAIGQFAVGIVTLSQIGAGLLLGFGQIQASLGLVVAQISMASVVPAAQFGFGMYQVLYAQLGFQVRPFFKRTGPLFVSCCKYRSRTGRQQYSEYESDEPGQIY